MNGFTTISDAARIVGIPPKRICNMFFSGRLDDSRCPRLGRRRLIPLDYIAEIKAKVKETDEATSAKRTV
ncbi:MAG TPA: hypothetical protein P5081_17620 [Phycisphaerae bacterium]|nr:hypothetical protein [Phycisphaerae bacterium]HRW54691.1 hypothetical protein [Phycisphaerae bacterium]